MVEIFHGLVVGAVHGANGIRFLVDGRICKYDNAGIYAELPRSRDVAAAGGNGNARHWLRQNRRREISALQHLKSYGNLRNNDLGDLPFVQSVHRENLIRHILDDGVA